MFVITSSTIDDYQVLCASIQNHKKLIVGLAEAIASARAKQRSHEKGTWEADATVVTIDTSVI